MENGRLRVELAELGTEHARLLARETAAAAELEALRAELATLRRMLFGRSSERASGGPPACAGAGDSGDGRDGAAGEG
ncbi:Transposase C of IS166 homeodomain, partial [Frankia sp. CeD]